VNRRTFLQSLAGLGVTSSAWPTAKIHARPPAPPAYFGLHPFIETHPEAVFVRLTSVPSRADSAAKRQQAYELARRIFILRDTPGIDLSHRFAIKPNLTSAKGTGLTYAIVTDPYVVEGLIDGMRGVNIPAGHIYVREGLAVEQPGTGYVELAERRGVHYGDQDARTPTTMECPDGVVFRRTKYLGPFNYPDCHLINVAKLKTHSMGLTLSVKNLQGTNLPPYIRFCGGLQRNLAQDFQPDAKRRVDDLLDQHRQAGFPRWDTEQAGWMEMWAQRTIDSYALIRPSLLLNVIEGVYAQNGDGFDGGPGRGGVPDIFLTNLLIFGKDAFRVDIIGHWLAGHEPGNFGLFHIGRERGVSTALNPRNIPIYRWEDSGPRLTPLEQSKRTPLATPYLQKWGEPKYHLVNEPFSYPPEPASACLSGDGPPAVRVLGQARPAHGPASVSIEYSLPEPAYAKLEVYDALGQRLAVLAQGRILQGIHAADWPVEQAAPGDYLCRLLSPGVNTTAPVAIAA
jgi:uncharacterized protein (DUF362 family)